MHAYLATHAWSFWKKIQTSHTTNKEPDTIYYICVQGLSCSENFEQYENTYFNTTLYFICVCKWHRAGNNNVTLLQYNFQRMFDLDTMYIVHSLRAHDTASNMRKRTAVLHSII